MAQQGAEVTGWAAAVVWCMLSGRSPPPESRAVARRSIPYPPSPTDCPEELTDPGRDSALEIIAVLSGLVLFLLIYVGLAVACLGVLLAVTTSLPRLPYPLLWVLAAPFAAGLLLILLNGLFHRTDP